MDVGARAIKFGSSLELVMHGLPSLALCQHFSSASALCLLPFLLLVQGQRPAMTLPAVSLELFTLLVTSSPYSPNDKVDKERAQEKSALLALYRPI